MEQCNALGYGIVYSPADPRKIIHKFSHIIDNGAWTAYKTKQPWNKDAFYSYLSTAKNPDFVVIPDIVAGGKASLIRSTEHIQRLKKYTLYLAVQPGIIADDIGELLIYIKGIFIGGDSVWKWRTAEYWREYSYKNGIKCHIGGVGTKQLYDYAYAIGVDSVDGSTPVRHGKIDLVPKWINEITNQSRLIK